MFEFARWDPELVVFRFHAESDHRHSKCASRESAPERIELLHVAKQNICVKGQRIEDEGQGVFGKPFRPKKTPHQRLFGASPCKKGACIMVFGKGVNWRVAQERFRREERTYKSGETGQDWQSAPRRGSW